MPLVRDAHLKLIETAAGTVRQIPYYNHYSHSVVEYLRDYLQRKVPQPAYYEGESQFPSVNVPSAITSSFAAAGLKFSPWQIATFYTSLQVKGFVILSGISGTGKTKLAQHFAELLPQPGSTKLSSSQDMIRVTVRPYFLGHSYFIIPKSAEQFYEPPEPGVKTNVKVTFDGQTEICTLSHLSNQRYDITRLFLRSKVAQWLKSNFAAGDVLFMEPQLGSDGETTGFRLFSQESLPSPDTDPNPKSQNHLFVPVRPDWRDSKSLLGYYNPLTQTYEWTPFLHFLNDAIRSFQAKDGLAWFVLLDEMNLARVEYYFADLLSVLESGRTEDGLTREPLRLTYPEDAQGELPRREMYLPPNLYIIGTVNVDETTHTFSPKVLDRAFTLEFTEVDFTNYPPETPSDAATRYPATSKAILDDFTLGGDFKLANKSIISEYTDAHPELRNRLEKLNELLKPYNLHFGYRVFDEIVAFLYAAEKNGMFDNLREDITFEDTAFDAAILMKVLPKFHGSLSKLKEPLVDVLSWCANPDEPAHESIVKAIDEAGGGYELNTKLSGIVYKLPNTAERTIRMLQSLYTDGFASFS